MSRQPSALERRYIARNTLNCYLNFNVTATYNKPVSKAQVSQALRTIMLTNDNLLLNAFRKDPSDTMEDDRRANGHNWVIKPVQKVRFDDVVSVEKIEQDTHQKESQIIAEYLSRLSSKTCALNIDTPPWRLLIYETGQKTYLTFYFDHTFYDGYVGAQLHKDLIEQLDKQDEPEYVDVLYDQEHDKMPNLYLTYYQQEQLYSPPWYYSIMNKIGQLKVVKWVSILFEQIAYRFTSIGFLRKVFGLRFRLHPSALSRPIFSYKPTTMNFATKFQIVNLSQAELKEVLGFCKKHRLTFTPFLDVLALQTMEQVIRPQVSPTPISYFHFTATNGRRYFPYMKYVTAASAFPTMFGDVDGLTKEQTIDIIKSHGERIVKLMKHMVPFRSQGMGMESTNFWDFFLGCVGQIIKPTSVVTNIGNQKFECGQWKIENMWFSQGNGASFHFVFNVVSSHAGMNIVIGSLPEYEELMEGKMMETFGRKLKENIMEISRMEHWCNRMKS